MHFGHAILPSAVLSGTTMGAGVGVVVRNEGDGEEVGRMVVGVDGLVDWADLLTPQSEHLLPSRLLLIPQRPQTQLPPSSLRFGVRLVARGGDDDDEERMRMILGDDLK